MQRFTFLARGSALAGAAAMSLGLSALHAQEAQTQDEAAPGDTTQQPAETAQAEQDATVATVGDTEILASDVMTFIQSLPPQMQQQPPQMLVPMAMEQLVLRELILQQARSENFAEDAEVRSMVDESARVAEDDAMVRVWLLRELESRVTDERVQQVYEELQANAEQEVPPLEAIRPQIVQELNRRDVSDIRAELQDNVSVVYYGPDGQPVEATADPTAPGGEAAETPAEGAEPAETGGSSDAGGAEPAEAGGSDDAGGAESTEAEGSGDGDDAETAAPEDGSAEDQSSN